MKFNLLDKNIILSLIKSLIYYIFSKTATDSIFGDRFLIYRPILLETPDHFS